MKTFPIKKRINTELFIGRKDGLYIQKLALIIGNIHEGQTNPA